MKLFGFSKKEHIRKRKDFLAVIASGQKLQTKHFIIYLRVNSQPFSRLGITVSHRVGKAVQRNRVKRLLREFFRLHKKDFHRGLDLVIIAKKGAADLTYQQVSGELSKVLRCKD